MKIGFSNQTFRGVEIIGSTKNDDNNFNLNFRKQFSKAIKRKNALENNDVDSFVVGQSVRDHLGAKTCFSTTYVLSGEEAKVVKKFDNIKKDLQNIFNAEFNMSDIFAIKFQNQIDKITQQQNEVAEFIAVNKLPV